MMIRLFFCFALLLSLSSTGYTQIETLLSEEDDAGILGGLFIEMSPINGEFGTDVGGAGAIFYNGFFLGGYGQGTKFPNFTDNQENDYELNFRHGGLWMGYIAFREKVVHPMASLKMGWGKVRLNPEMEGVERVTDNHFTLIPQLGVQVNVTNSMHVAFTGGYRIVSGLEDQTGRLGLTEEDINGAVAQITFTFGGF